MPVPVRIKKKVDVFNLLKDYGFIVTFSGKGGYMKLMHPELIVEFLVPERGRGTDKPYPLPHLGINAQPLRFLDFLIQNTMIVKSEDLRIRLPHPAAFGLHKLIISGRRKTEEKSLKEVREATDVLRVLIEKGESPKVKVLFDDMPASWQKRIIKVLQESGNEGVLKIFK